MVIRTCCASKNVGVLINVLRPSAGHQAAAKEQQQTHFLKDDATRFSLGITL